MFGISILTKLFIEILNIVKMIILKIIFLGKSLNKVVCLLRTQYILSIRFDIAQKKMHIKG